MTKCVGASRHAGLVRHICARTTDCIRAGHFSIGGAALNLGCAVSWSDACCVGDISAAACACFGALAL